LRRERWGVSVWYNSLTVSSPVRYVRSSERKNEGFVDARYFAVEMISRVFIMVEERFGV
jgi:hypothetical protein